MNLKVLATASWVVGLAIAIFAGTAIARRAGFGTESWLMAAFALGLVMLSHSPVLRLKQELRDIQERLRAGSDA
jgi:hypothetical protein